MEPKISKDIPIPRRHMLKILGLTAGALLTGCITPPVASPSPTASPSIPSVRPTEQVTREAGNPVTDSEIAATVEALSNGPYKEFLKDAYKMAFIDTTIATAIHPTSTTHTHISTTYLDKIVAGGSTNMRDDTLVPQMLQIINPAKDTYIAVALPPSIYPEVDKPGNEPSIATEYTEDKNLYDTFVPSIHFTMPTERIMRQNPHMKAIWEESRRFMMLKELASIGVFFAGLKEMADAQQKLKLDSFITTKDGQQVFALPSAAFTILNQGGRFAYVVDLLGYMIAIQALKGTAGDLQTLQSSNPDYKDIIVKQLNEPFLDTLAAADIVKGMTSFLLGNTTLYNKLDHVGRPDQVSTSPILTFGDNQIA